MEVLGNVHKIISVEVFPGAMFNSLLYIRKESLELIRSYVTLKIGRNHKPTQALPKGGMRYSLDITRLSLKKAWLLH